jgi:hypothetical protein
MSKLLQVVSWRLNAHTRLGIIATVLTLASPLWAAARLGLTMNGRVTSVDPALQSVFHVGDPFKFGFTIDPAEIHDVGYGVLIYGRDLNFKVGGNYTGISSTEYGEVVFSHDSLGNGPTGQGITFEKNNMISPAVNGFPLSDTYIDIGLINAFNTAQIREPQLLALNGQTIVNQDNSLSFDFSPRYKYLKFDIDSIVVLVPEPGCGLAILALGLALRRRSRGTFLVFD